jgi:hypothetical protein
MQVGCGVYIHTVRGKRYLYFWHYENRGGSRVQVKEYLGPVDSPRTRSDAAQRCETYFAQAAEHLEQLRNNSLAAIRAMAGH